MSLKKSIFIIVSVILIDQISKIYVKTHFQLGDSIKVFSWFEILFIENDGMAWGAKLSDFTSLISDKSAKLILTLFRLLAILGIGYWLYSVIKDKGSKTLIVSVSLIFAGALGNIIDSVFYGLLFGNSFNEVALFLPKNGGYANLFYGNVVDMLHFPLWTGVFPRWLPIIGGKAFTFFEPVFNIADMAISTGVGVLILFNKRVFLNKKNSNFNN